MMKKFSKIAAALLLVSLLVLAFSACFNSKEDILIEFNTSGGSAIAPQTITKGQSIKRPDNPERAGYTFDGWYTSPAIFSQENLWNFTDTVSKNLTLYANWNIVFYTVSYHLGGGVNNADNPVTYTVETDTVTLADPSYDGSIFAGWSLDNGIIEKGSTGNKTFAAIWSSDPNVVQYNLNGGSNEARNLISYTRVIGGLTLADPQKNYYIFDGWFTTPDFKGAPVTHIAQAPQGLITLYAKWYSDNLSFTLLPDKSGYSVGRGIQQFFNYGTLIIPAMYNSLPVKALMGTTFASNPNILALSIPDTVEEIGELMFSGCTDLVSVVIPNSVKTIGQSAFRNCWDLTSITIPFVGNTLNGLSNTRFVWIFGSLFNIPSSLKTVIITGGSRIGRDAFRDFADLTSITIPDTVTTIEGWAFRGCTGLTSIEIPNSVTSIGQSAFEGCTGLTSITIPDSVITIGQEAFTGCTGLTYIEIPASVTNIAVYAFYACTGLTAITVDALNPNYASEDGVFFNKNKTVLIAYPAGKTGAYIVPDSVETIQNYAFAVCTKLTSVTIPDTVTVIQSWAFIGSTALTAITVDALNSNYTSKDGILFNKNQTVLLAYPAGKIGAYTIPDSVTAIGEYAFANCAGLISVTIPDSVTSIGESAFWDCTGLTSIEIPASVTSIEVGAFWECTNLSSIIFQNGSQLTEIEDFTFGSTAITSIEIPDFVTSIGQFSFYGCTELTNVVIPNSVTRINSSAFWGCSALIFITIPASVTEIGSGAFFDCQKLYGIYVQGHTERPDGWDSNWNRTDARVFWGQ
ncbi:MAG: leucine-rich repeat protein [Firmicutes bacterium]|nr:leucine-rich repeat protein [Bacillota bacterium]